MPVYCRCNGKGRCISCACIKSGSRCIDCLPSRNGHCSNRDPAASNARRKHEQEYSQTLSPSRHTSPSSATTDDTTRSPEAEADKDSNSPDFVAMIDDVSTTPLSPGSISESEAPNCSLPSFRPTLGTDYTWGDLSGQVFTSLIDEAYSQVVHWRPNLFKVPSGSSGKRFVAELAHLYEAYATESALEPVALTAAMTLPALMLQKPHAKLRYFSSLP